MRDRGPPLRCSSAGQLQVTRLFVAPGEDDADRRKHDRDGNNDQNGVECHGASPRMMGEQASQFGPAHFALDQIGRPDAKKPLNLPPGLRQLSLQTISRRYSIAVQQLQTRDGGFR